MPYIDRYEIPEDQYDNGNIKGTKRTHQIKAHLKQMDDARLLSIFTDFYASDGGFNYSKPEFQAFADECGPCNLTTLMLMAAEEAYMRQDENGNDLLDEDDFLRLQDEG